MDAFYASVEQRDFPEYRGKPLVVGGSPEGRGGVVATASYEARKFGIRSAMPSKTAQRLCPQAIFVFPRFDAYKAVSSQLHEILHRYTDIIEPVSLDEAYLDVTADKRQIGSAIEIAKLIKKNIKEELQLTASAGVSINKFVAKIASDMNKPDGLTFIGPSSIEKFMENLPVIKFFGVGKVTAAKMQSMNLNTGADLKKLSENEMVKHFGKTGAFFYNIIRGIDNREVQPYRETKSISVEDTFAYDLENIDEMKNELEKLAERLAVRLHRKNLKGRTITLKIKYSNFKTITRNHSFLSPTNEGSIILQNAYEMLGNCELDDKVRLLGIGISNFKDIHSNPKDSFAKTNQLKLF